MKKMSFLAAVLAVVLVAGSSFKKQGLTSPTLYKDGSGNFQTIAGPYNCDTPPNDQICTYNADESPSGELGVFVKLW